MGAYVVVIFGGAAEGWCDLEHCPMGVIGPFETNDRAQQEAAQFPAEFRAHVLMLSTF